MDKELNENLQIQIKNFEITDDGKYICPHCGKKYCKNGIGTHVWRNHTEKGKQFNPNDFIKNRVSWNKGKTKETDERIKRSAETYKQSYKNGNFAIWCKDKHLPDDVKKRISESMKKAHKEGRAWNIGMSRWNNEKSYPEKFFTKVIENEFNDKEYKTEYPLTIYALDFAWPHKKKCIEIDGEQHQRFTSYIERDKRKDECIKEHGWTCLRIKWFDLYNDTKYWIKIAKEFIDN